MEVNPTRNSSLYPSSSNIENKEEEIDFDAILDEELAAMQVNSTSNSPSSFNLVQSNSDPTKSSPSSLSEEDSEQILIEMLKGMGINDEQLKVLEGLEEVSDPCMQQLVEEIMREQAQAQHPSQTTPSVSSKPPIPIPDDLPNNGAIQVIVQVEMVLEIYKEDPEGVRKVIALMLTLMPQATALSANTIAMNNQDDNPIVPYFDLSTQSMQLVKIFVNQLNAQEKNDLETLTPDDPESLQKSQIIIKNLIDQKKAVALSTSHEAESLSEKDIKVRSEFLKELGMKEASFSSLTKLVSHPEFSLNACIAFVETCSSAKAIWKSIKKHLLVMNMSGGQYTSVYEEALSILKSALSQKEFEEFQVAFISSLKRLLSKED